MGHDYKERETVWAVVRYDSYQADAIDAFTVKEIVHDRAAADAEPARLNALNSGKNCHYWVVMGRLYPRGTSAGPADHLGA